MNAKAVTFVLVLVSLGGGCSSLPGGASRYEDPPALNTALDTTPFAEADGTDAVAEQDDTTGLKVAKRARRTSGSIDPLATLQATMAMRPEMPRDERIGHIRPSAPRDPSTTATLGHTQPADVRPLASSIQAYDRDALTARLFAQGKKAAPPICEGC